MQNMVKTTGGALDPQHAMIAVSLLRLFVRHQPSFATAWPGMMKVTPAHRSARVARCGTVLTEQHPLAIDLPPTPRRPRIKRRRPRLASYPIAPVLLRVPPRLAITSPGGKSVTPLMAELERILCRIAETGGELPNNPLLGERCGGRGRSSIDRALRRLSALGRITIESRGNQRRIYVEDVDAYTDWGESRPGHAPFCRNRRGTLGKKQTQLELPMLSGRTTLPRLASLSGFNWKAPAVSTAPAARCQFPLWEDGSAPDGRYCSAPVVNSCAAISASFCAEHRALVFQPRRRRHAGINTG